MDIRDIYIYIYTYIYILANLAHHVMFMYSCVYTGLSILVSNTVIRCQHAARLAVCIRDASIGYFRLFRRLKYHHCKYKDGKHVKGRTDVDLWQDGHPIAGSDFPNHRWQRYSGLRPALPPDMASQRHTASPRRHSSPPVSVTAPVPYGGTGSMSRHGPLPHSQLVVVRGRPAALDEHSPGAQSEHDAVTSCLPTKRRVKKRSDSPGHYGSAYRHSVDTCTQTDTVAAHREDIDAAYMEFLHQEFANKYRFLTQGDPPITDSPEMAPKQVLSLGDFLQSPPKSIVQPEMACTRRHTVEMGTPSPRTYHQFLMPPQTPLKTETDNRRSVHFHTNSSDNYSDIVTDFENVRNQLSSEEVTKRRKRKQKQRRRQRIRNQIYRKLMSPKGYKQLKEQPEDKPEIERLELEFEEKKIVNLRRKWPNQENKDVSVVTETEMW